MRLPSRARPVAAAIPLYWLTTLAVAARADDLDLDPLGIANVLVLAPIGLVGIFVLAERIAGVALGAWALFVSLATPWLIPLLTLSSYDTTMRDTVLPLAVGLEAALEYAEGAAVLATVVLLSTRGRVAKVAGGLVGTVLLAVWLSRLPLPELTVDAFKFNMANLREHFWSHRLLQWMPIAGGAAVARRSVPLALALVGWVGAYVAFRAAQPDIGVQDGELFRELLPALPAYVLLASALPLLVPTLAARLGPLARAAGSPP